MLSNRHNAFILTVLALLVMFNASCQNNNPSEQPVNIQPVEENVTNESNNLIENDNNASSESLNEEPRLRKRKHEVGVETTGAAGLEEDIPEQAR